MQIVADLRGISIGNWDTGTPVINPDIAYQLKDAC